MVKKIYPLVVGNTLGSHETFLERIKKRGAKIVNTEGESDETIVFCPIVTRFETDIQSALSNLSGDRQVILVAMHHTYDPNYILPDTRSFDKSRVKLFVECLFFETEGFYKCERNSKAKKSVYEKLRLSKLGKRTSSSKNAESKKSNTKGKQNKTWKSSEDGDPETTNKRHKLCCF